MIVSPSDAKWVRIEHSIPYLTVGELTVGRLIGGPTAGSADRAVGSCGDSLLLSPIVQGSSVTINGAIYFTVGKSYYIKAAVEKCTFANHIGSATLGWSNVSLPTTTIVGGGAYNPVYGFPSTSFVYTPISNAPVALTLVGQSGLVSIGKILVEITVL